MKIENCKLKIILAVIMFLPSSALALEVFPSIGGVSVTESMGPADWIKYIFLAAQALVGLAIIYAFVRAGVLWMTGGDNPGHIKEAKERIYGALIGLVILLGSYIFLKTINPQLVAIKNPSIQFKSDEPSGMLDFWSKLFISKHGAGEACGSDFDCGGRLICKRENSRNAKGKCTDTEGNSCDKDNKCESEYFCIDSTTAQSVDFNIAGAHGTCTLKRPLGAVCTKFPTETTTCYNGLVCQDTTGDNDYECTKNSQPNEPQPASGGSTGLVPSDATTQYKYSPNPPRDLTPEELTSFKTELASGLTGEQVKILDNSIFVLSDVGLEGGQVAGCAADAWIKRAQEFIKRELTQEEQNKAHPLCLKFFTHTISVYDYELEIKKIFFP